MCMIERGGVKLSIMYAYKITNFPEFFTHPQLGLFRSNLQTTFPVDLQVLTVHDHPVFHRIPLTNNVWEYFSFLIGTFVYFDLRVWHEQTFRGNGHAEHVVLLLVDHDQFETPNIWWICHQFLYRIKDTAHIFLPNFIHVRWVLAKISSLRVVFTDQRVIIEKALFSCPATYPKFFW